MDKLTVQVAEGFIVTVKIDVIKKRAGPSWAGNYLPYFEMDQNSTRPPANNECKSSGCCKS